MESQHSLTGFLHHSASVYFVHTNLEGKFTYVNRLFETIFGTPSPQQTLRESIYEEDLDLFDDAIKECIEKRTKVACADIRKVRSDGSKFWIRWEFGILVDSDDRAIGVRALGTDFTERKRAESERAEAQERLELLLNTTDESFILIAPDLTISNFNRAASRMVVGAFGTALRKGAPVLEFAVRERRDYFRGMLRSVLEGTEHVADLRIEKDGVPAIYANTFKPVRNQSGEIVAVIVTSRDVTENKLAEEKLRRERYLLRILIDHLPDYIYVKDTQFRHIINNRANVELIGASTEEETIGKTVVDYFPGDVAQEYIDKDREVMETGVPATNVEEEIISNKGEHKWLLTTKVPLKDESDNVIGVVGISRDITERKMFEESLRSINERYRIVSKATNDAIWDWDFETGQMVWNEAIKTLFLYANDESIHQFDFWENSIHPDDKEHVLQRLQYHIDERIEIWNDEYRFLCGDGSYKVVYDRGYILFNEKRQPIRMIGAMMDITQRRELEKQLAAETIARQRQITEATIQAQEKERGELGRELHDNINQILTTTKLYLDMAIVEKDIREELLTKCHSNVSTVIEEIRMLSRSLVPPSLGDIGLREAISEMIGNLNIAQKLKINLKTQGVGSTVVPGNIKLMVYRIIQEQLNNVLKHSKATEADIKLAVSKKVLNITVTDNGVGFDPRKKNKGIGLSNITSRAELHNGQVEIISSPGHGCTVKVCIPL
jgi:two-component system, NarL family, sensor histidine kinase UhpB